MSPQKEDMTTRQEQESHMVEGDNLWTLGSPTTTCVFLVAENTHQRRERMGQPKIAWRVLMGADFLSLL